MAEHKQRTWSRAGHGRVCKWPLCSSGHSRRNREVYVPHLLSERGPSLPKTGVTTSGVMDQTDKMGGRLFPGSIYSRVQKSLRMIVGIHNLALKTALLPKEMPC